MAITLESTTLDVIRMTDASVSEKLELINDEIPGSLTVNSFKAFFTTHRQNLNGEQGRSEYDTLLAMNSVLIESLKVACSAGVNITFNRQMASKNNGPDGFDRLTFNPTQETSLESFAKILSAFRNAFVVIESSEEYPTNSDHQKQILTERTAVLDKLQSIHHRLTADLSDFTLKQTKENQEHQRSLEEQHQQKLNELDARRTELETEIEAKRKSLEEEKRELDLRDSTTVRRSIRDTMRELLAERANGFDLSDATERHARRVMMYYSALLGFFGLLTVFYLYPAIAYELSSLPANDNATSASTGPNWLDIVRLIRPIFPILGFVVTSGFFIKWLNKRAQRHTDDEFMSRQYELDFERASFVVEWAMEWAKEGREVPQYLIERLSRGLFEFEHTEETSATAADAVASALFGSASQLELEVAGNKVSVGRKGIKTLQNTTLPKEE